MAFRTPQLMFSIVLALVVVQCAEAQVAELEATDSASVTIQLVEPGATPRHKLRFRPTKGAVESILMTMDMQQSIKINELKLPAPAMPTQIFTVTFTIADVTPEGDIRMEYEYEKVEIEKDPENPSPFAAMIEQGIKPLEGLTGYAVIDSRGIAKESDMDIPEGVSAMLKTMFEGMKQSMQNLSSPLPEEPVGIGGKWRVTQELDMNGISLTQSSLFELVEVSGDRYAIKADLTQVADAQQVESPQLPAGAQLELQSLNSTGAGTLVIKPTSIIPDRSTMEIASKTAMKIAAGGQDQSMETDMTMKITIAPIEEIE